MEKHTIEIGDMYYNKAKEVADLIDYDVRGVIEDVIYNCLEDLFDEEIQKANRAKMDIDWLEGWEEPINKPIGIDY